MMASPVKPAGPEKPYERTTDPNRFFGISWIGFAGSELGETRYQAPGCHHSPKMAPIGLLSTCNSQRDLSSTTEWDPCTYHELFSRVVSMNAVFYSVTRAVAGARRYAHRSSRVDPSFVTKSPTQKRVRGTHKIEPPIESPIESITNPSFVSRFT